MKIKNVLIFLVFTLLVSATVFSFLCSNNSSSITATNPTHQISIETQSPSLSKPCSPSIDKNEEETRNYYRQQTSSSYSSKSITDKPTVIFISYIDQKASAGYLHAAMLRQCYCRKFNYRLIVYNEYDLVPWTRVFSSARNSSSSQINMNTNNNTNTTNHQKLSYNSSIDRWFDISSDVSPEDEAKYWSKLYLMKRTLLHETKSQSDWVVYVDADTIQSQASVSFEDLLSQTLKNWYGPENKKKMIQRKESQMRVTRARFLQAQRESSDQQQQNHPPVTVKTLPNGKKVLAKIFSSLTKSFEVPLESFEDNSSSILPDLLLSNNVNIINNGVFAMRNTIWSQEFLIKWFNDRKLNHHYFDNGPFIHSVLREQLHNQFLKYDNECSSQGMRTRHFQWKKYLLMKNLKTDQEKKEVLKNYDWSSVDATARHFTTFQSCYIHMLSTQAVKKTEDPFNVLTRCPTVSYLDNQSEALEKHQRDLKFNASLRSSPFYGSSTPASSSSSLNATQFAIERDKKNAKELIEFVNQVRQDFGKSSSRRMPGFISGEEANVEGIKDKSFGGYAFHFGWIRNDDPFIVGNCRMNNGIGHIFNPAGSWRKDDSWIAHFAGWKNSSSRSNMMYMLALRMKKHFKKEQCF